MAQWWGDATTTEISALGQWIRSDMKSIPAARKLLKLKLIQLDPPGLTARGTEILGKLPAGLIEQRLCRGTGHRVSIYDSDEAGLDPVEKYTMVCEPHNMLTTTETLKLARFHAVVPEWCPVCSGQEQEEPEENPVTPMTTWKKDGKHWNLVDEDGEVLGRITKHKLMGGWHLVVPGFPNTMQGDGYTEVRQWLYPKVARSKKDAEKVIRAVREGRDAWATRREKNPGPSTDIVRKLKF